MKSLLDIQQDIRKLENSLKDITESIKVISSDIELIRTPEQDISIDFELIKVLAKNINYDKHPISEINDKSEQQTYIEMLINIVRFDIDREVDVNRLTFIQWLLNQTEIEYGLEDLYKNSIKMNDKLYLEDLQELSEDYREYFVLDSLIIANIAGTANMEIQRYVADIASIIGVDSKNLYKLAILTKWILCRDFSKMTQVEINIVQNNYELCNYYISGLRYIAVCIKDDDYSTFYWKKEHLERVKAGDLIIKYTLRENKWVALVIAAEIKGSQYKPSREVFIKAPVDGILYCFEYKNVIYGVISQEEDNIDLIREWIANKNN